MPTTKTGYWICVKNGEVTDVWDTTPDYQNQAGWHEAVEVFPDITPNREIITTHSFDLTANPAQIVWAKREVTLEERKGALSDQAKQKFAQVTQEETRKQLSDNADEFYDAAAVETVLQDMLTKQAAIGAASTHEELDALMA
jgi:hypothetical protein